MNNKGSFEPKCLQNSETAPLIKKKTPLHKKFLVKVPTCSTPRQTVVPSWSESKKYTNQSFQKTTYLLNTSIGNHQSKNINQRRQRSSKKLIADIAKKSKVYGNHINFQVDHNLMKENLLSSSQVEPIKNTAAIQKLVFRTENNESTTIANIKLCSSRPGIGQKRTHYNPLAKLNRRCKLRMKTVQQQENDENVKNQSSSVIAIYNNHHINKNNNKQNEFCVVSLFDTHKSNENERKSLIKQFRIKVTTTTQFRQHLRRQVSFNNVNVVGFTSIQPSNCLFDLFLTFQNCDISYLNNGSKLSLQTVRKKVSSKTRINIQSFEILKCIGKGGFSKVFLCRFKEDGKFYAMKTINKNFIVQGNKSSIVMNEKEVMQKLNHPFIIDMKFAFETCADLVFILQYCPGGEMFSLVKKFKRFPEDIARFYMIQILIGLQHIHKQGILYRDFKPENILIDIDGHVKIADFGLAKPNYFSSRDRAYSFCGSPEYMPPEMVLKQGHSLSMDFYCLGAVLYELVTGLPPFYSKNVNEIYQGTVNQQISFPEKTPLSSEIKNLLSGLLCKQERYRMGSLFGAKQILAHPWFGKFNRSQYQNKQKTPPINFRSIDSISLNPSLLKQKGHLYVAETVENQKQQLYEKRDFTHEIPQFYFDYRQSPEKMQKQLKNAKQFGKQHDQSKQQNSERSSQFRTTIQRHSSSKNFILKKSKENKISLAKLRKKEQAEVNSKVNRIF